MEHYCNTVKPVYNGHLWDLYKSGCYTELTLLYSQVYV